MGYAVFHRDGTDTPWVEDVDSLESAIAIVEQLRNQDATSDVRVFREVPLEVRTYYKVVVADQDAAEAAPSPVAVADTPPPAPEPAVDAAPDDVRAAAADSSLWDAAPGTDGQASGDQASGDQSSGDQAPDDLSSMPVDEPAAATGPVTPAVPVEPLPGAFPLAARTAPPHVEVNDTNVEGESGRRHSLFGRGG